MKMVNGIEVAVPVAQQAALDDAAAVWRADKAVRAAAQEAVHYQRDRLTAIADQVGVFPHNLVESLHVILMAVVTAVESGDKTELHAIKATLDEIIAKSPPPA